MNLEEFTRFAQSQGFKCLPNGVFGTIAFETPSD